MSLTIVIIAITVIASIYAWNRQDKFYSWLMNPYSIVHRNQYQKLLTSGFIHADWIHLFFNMFTLYFFGNIMEKILNYYFDSSGPFYFLLLYFLGMLIADIPSVIKHRNNPNYNSLGASGAVSAVLFASILFVPTNKICLFAALCMPGFIFGILYLIYTYYQGRRMADNINHDAHLFGALFGIIFSMIIKPDVIGSFFDQILNWRIF